MGEHPNYAQSTLMTAALQPSSRITAPRPPRSTMAFIGHSSSPSTNNNSNNNNNNNSNGFHRDSSSLDGATIPCKYNSNVLRSRESAMSN